MADRQFLPRCVPHSSGRGVLLILLFFLISGTALPQQGTDIRISEDIREPAIPSDIRIQTGAELADARLAVWGTTVEGPSGEARNALVFDLGNGPQPLHSSDAEPYAQVAVAPLTDRFLLLWNDRRPSGAGIYGRVVLKEGSFGGPEYLFSSGGKLEDRVYWMNGLTGTTILWNDVRGAEVMVYRRRVDGEGRVVGIEESLGSGGIVEHQVSRLPDGRVVLGRESGEGMVLGLDGEMEAEGIAAERLRRPHYMGEDGSFAMLDSNRFLYYEDIRAPEPVWERRFTADHYDPLDYDLAFLRQRADTFVLLRFALGHSSFDPYPYSSLKIIQIESSLFTSAYDSARTLRDTLHWFGSSDDMPQRIVFKKHLDECEDISRGLIGLEHEYINTRNKYQTAVVFSVDREGRVRDVWRRTVASGISYEKDFTILAQICRPLGLPGANRLRADTLSSIRVYWSGGEWIEYAVDAAGYRHTPHQSPVIGLYNGRIKVGWYRPEANRLEMLSFTDFPDGVDSLSSHLRVDMKYEGTRREGLRYQNGGVLLGDAALITGVSDPTGHPDHRYNHLYMGFCTHFFGEGGWRRVTVYEDMNAHPYLSPRMPIHGIGYDPNADLIAVSFYELFGGNGRSSFAFVSPSDTVITTAYYSPPPWPLRQIFPLDSGSVLLIGDEGRGRIVEVNRGWSDVVWPLDPPYQSTRYHRLHGFLLLRESVRPGMSSRRLDLLSIDGGIIDSAIFEGIPDSAGFFLVQNPDDSSFHLLYGGSGGVRYTHLDRHLRVVPDGQGRPEFDLRISDGSGVVGSPAGVLRNDSLFFVWLDEDQQVYANRMPITRVSDPSLVDIGGNRLHIYPGSARDVIVLSLPMTGEHDVIVECFDPVGKAGSVRIIQQLSDTVLVDISGLSRSLWLMRATVGDRTFFGKFLVFR